MKFETFNAIIETIKTFDIQEHEIVKTINSLAEDADGVRLKLTIIYDIIKSLEIEFNDQTNQWIEYWIYEADFGKCHSEIWENEKSISIATTEDFYKLLLKMYNE